MKKILAVVLVSVMLISSSLTVFATSSDPATTTEEALTGSYSITKEEWEEMQKNIKKLEEDNQRLLNKIDSLTNAVNAKGKAPASNGGGGGGGGSKPSSSSNSGNWVNWGGNIVYQGGKIEINGGRSNVTFTIKTPDGGTMTSAANLANSVGGSLINCIETSSPGVAFSTAKVNFYVRGVVPGDNIAVYQAQGGKWVQLPVVEIRQDHVVVSMSRHGALAFVRVPALASLTH